ncbi:glycosyltransferase [Candidatus Saccharibacteria bacterium]|nr:glycosyltransferase [Candidatus Saccharibacteria bacterium]
MRIHIKDSSFIISTNGFADGPAQALRDYLLDVPCETLTVLNHPLVSENKGEHLVTTYTRGKEKTAKKYNLPNKPPYTYLFDPLVPLSLPASTAWFGFNNLAALRGLVRRKRGSVDNVYYWAVDFVPNRFGEGVLTRAYNKLDGYVSKNVDARIELSKAALAGRTKHLGLSNKSLATAFVVPMGAWLGKIPKANTSNWKNKKIVYLGHLVERQGVDRLIKAIGILNKEGIDIRLEVVGDGPMLNNLKEMTNELGISQKAKFHGFVKEHKDVEAILASATVAVAPYVKDEKSFTQFADPGKLKAYLGAGLPIVLTDVPPNASGIESAGAGIVVNDSPESIAEAIKSYITNQAKWSEAHKNSLIYAKQFDWNDILTEVLGKIGFK